MKSNKVLLPFGKTIYQSSDGHSVTSDTAALVNKILEDNKEKDLSLLDLGSGNGIISIMLKYYQNSWKCTGLEIQEKLVNMAIKNARKTNLEVAFINGDLRNYNWKDRKFDIIASNPPYIKFKQGRTSPNQERAISRQEICCQMTDILQVIKNQLKNNGNAYLIYPESRSLELRKTTKKIDLIILEKFILADKIVKCIFVIAKRRDKKHKNLK